MFFSKPPKVFRSFPFENSRASEQQQKNQVVLVFTYIPINLARAQWSVDLTCSAAERGLFTTVFTVTSILKNLTFKHSCQMRETTSRNLTLLIFHLLNEWQLLWVTFPHIPEKKEQWTGILYSTASQSLGAHTTNGLHVPKILTPQQEGYRDNESPSLTGKRTFQKMVGNKNWKNGGWKRILSFKLSHFGIIS